MPQVLYNLVLDRMQKLKLLNTLYTIFFSEENTECVLLIKEENAFSSINRKVMLHNMKFLCPLISTYIYVIVMPYQQGFSSLEGVKFYLMKGQPMVIQFRWGLRPLAFYQYFTVCLILIYQKIFKPEKLLLLMILQLPKN